MVVKQGGRGEVRKCLWRNEDRINGNDTTTKDAGQTLLR
jgi:hypothetical protein